METKFKKSLAVLSLVGLLSGCAEQQTQVILPSKEEIAAKKLEEEKQLLARKVEEEKQLLANFWFDSIKAQRDYLVNKGFVPNKSYHGNDSAGTYTSYTYNLDNLEVMGRKVKAQLSTDVELTPTGYHPISFFTYCTDNSILYTISARKNGLISQGLASQGIKLENPSLIGEADTFARKVFSEMQKSYSNEFAKQEANARATLTSRLEK